MVEVVNLRQARKRKARSDAQTQASENRALFGRSKQEKDADKAARRLAEKRLEGHRRVLGAIGTDERGEND